MGREQLEALVRVLQEQLKAGPDGVVVGSWSIRYEKEKDGFYFDKCEWGGYCEERPSLISVGGDVLDKGGPLF